MTGPRTCVIESCQCRAMPKTLWCFEHRDVRAPVQPVTRPYEIQCLMCGFTVDKYLTDAALSRLPRLFCGRCRSDGRLSRMMMRAAVGSISSADPSTPIHHRAPYAAVVKARGLTL